MKNFRRTEIFRACVSYLSQSVQTKAKVHPVCWLFSIK